MGIHGKYYWDVYAIFDNLKKSIAAARDLGVKLDSIGIDTWGCDFGYIAADGTLLGLPRAYRDQYTVGTPEKTYEIVPRKELYAHTGIQIMNFNSIFQIFKAKGREIRSVHERGQDIVYPRFAVVLLHRQNVHRIHRGFYFADAKRRNARLG